MPGFRGATGIKGALLDGWSLSGVGTLQSGLPFSIIDTRGGTIFGATSYAQVRDGVDLNSIAGEGDTQDRLNGYFDTTAFVAPPAIGNVVADHAAGGTLPVLTKTGAAAAVRAVRTQIARAHIVGARIIMAPLAH